VIPWLRCPLCGASLERSAAALRCASGHAFDIARQGYVSLLAGRLAPVGDTADMVQARAEFLAAGHYARLAEAVARAAGDLDTGAENPAGGVADIGAGTGYYLASVLDRQPGRAGLALDASKFAARRAARAHPRIGAVVADVRARLPIADGAAAVALSVFAPRPAAELRRILHPAGRLLVVTPDPDHLGELAGPLGLLAVDPRKEGGWRPGSVPTLTWSRTASTGSGWLCATRTWPPRWPWGPAPGTPIRPSWRAGSRPCPTRCRSRCP